MGGLYYDEQNWKLFDNKDLSGLDLEVHSIATDTPVFSTNTTQVYS
jgi:hypothetical protein